MITKLKAGMLVNWKCDLVEDPYNGTVTIVERGELVEEPHRYEWIVLLPNGDEKVAYDDELTIIEEASDGA